MTEADMKKLTRADLVEMLIQQSKELESLRTQLQDAEKALKNRRIAMDSAGSIAEAALQLNGVFEAAEASCQQYLENIRLLNDRLTKRDVETEQEAARLLEDTRKRCAAMEAETERKCARMLERSKAASEAFWDKAAARRGDSSRQTTTTSPRRIKEVDRKL